MLFRSLSARGSIEYVVVPNYGAEEDYAGLDLTGKIAQMCIRDRRNCVDMGYCTRERLQVPRGERYELCRSVHAEANAIISAARSETLGATLYMACKNPATGELIAGSTSCAMCRRLIINAGIQRVVIRNTKTDYSVVHVEDWVREDDSLPGEACSCCGKE